MTLPLQHETRAGSNTSSRQPTLPHPPPAMPQAQDQKKEDRDASHLLHPTVWATSRPLPHGESPRPAALGATAPALLGRTHPADATAAPRHEGTAHRASRCFRHSLPSGSSRCCVLPRSTFPLSHTKKPSEALPHYAVTSTRYHAPSANRPQARCKSNQCRAKSNQCGAPPTSAVHLQPVQYTSSAIQPQGKYHHCAIQPQGNPALSRSPLTRALSPPNP
jgi:hypothetical protein